MRIGDAIPKLFNAVVCFLHTRCLTLHQSARLRIKFGTLERIAVVRDRGIFTAFTFREYGMRFVRGQGSLQIDPAAMQRPADGTVFVRVTAQRTHALLQFSNVISALSRVLGKYPSQLGIFGIFRRGGESVFTVFAGLDEVVQYTDAFVLG